MPNYHGFTRTNYFSVTDPDRLRAILDKAVAPDGDVTLLTQEIDGVKRYAFKARSTIEGYPPPDGTPPGEIEYDDDTFAHDLQAIVAPGDAIAITEVGGDGRADYLYAVTQIITRDAIEVVEHYDAVCDRLCTLTGNDNFVAIFEN